MNKRIFNLALLLAMVLASPVAWAQTARVQHLTPGNGGVQASASSSTLALSAVGAVHNGFFRAYLAKAGEGAPFAASVLASVKEGTKKEGIEAGVQEMMPEEVAEADRSEHVAEEPETVVHEVSLPTAFALEANYPNPFNPETVLPFALPEATRVTLAVYDVMGRRVGVLVDEAMAAGHHTVTFRADGLPSGLYLVRMQAGSFVQTRRMTLIK